VGLLESLESSGIGEWVRRSLLGYPMMIAAHAVGMAVMVGLSAAFAMRVLGMFRDIPYPALDRFLVIAWIGFGVNFISGSFLFAAQATTYITDLTFQLKMGFVVASMITVAINQTQIKRYASAWGEGPVPVSTRVVAWLTLLFWVMAMIIGRLIAYV
jgi:hypothetical protein